MKEKRKILGMVLIILIGYIGFGVYSYIMRDVYGYTYPQGYFLFSPWDRFMDFFNVNKMVSERVPYVEYYSSYPPFILAIAFIFSLYGNYIFHTPQETSQTVAGFVSLMVFEVLFTGLYGLVVYKLISKRKDGCKNAFLMIIAVICLVYIAPYIYMLDRGNYLVINVILFCLFIYYYDTNETLAAVCIGLAAAIKIYPLFFLLLYFIDRKWINMKYMIYVGGAVTFLSLLLFKGGLGANIIEFGYAVLAFGGGYPNESPNVYFCVGLTSLLRFFSFIGKENVGIIPGWFPVMKIYLVYGTALTLWSVWNLMKERCFWKKIFVLTLLMVFLTPNSYMYNIIYLVPAIALFVVAEPGKKKWLDAVYLFLLGLLVIPKAYYYVSPENLVGIQTPIDANIIMLLILLYNLADKETREKKIELKQWIPRIKFTGWKMKEK